MELEPPALLSLGELVMKWQITESASEIHRCLLKDFYGNNRVTFHTPLGTRKNIPLVLSHSSEQSAVSWPGLPYRWLDMQGLQCGAGITARSFSRKVARPDTLLTSMRRESSPAHEECQLLHVHCLGETY